nr:hypothetical protein [Tanacetum cinerariifolium]
FFTNGIVERRNRTLVEDARTMLSAAKTMALNHDSLSPAIQRQANVPQADRTVTTSNELDLLFSTMFDELLNGSSKVVSKSSAVFAADALNQHQHHTTPLNNHTTPAPTCQVPTLAPTVISSKNINHAETYAKNDQVADDEFINIFSTPVQDQGETSSRHVDSSNMHTFYQRYPSENRWTKDHPLEQLIGNPSQSVRTRRQLELDAKCEELHQFDRLDVWELVDRPLCTNVINLKWLWKNKRDEENTIHQSLRAIFINQAKYAQEIIKKHGMTSCDSIGADEELSDGGSSRVIVYGYDRLPMLPVAPLSPDYIPVPEEPQTPPSPHDEDEHEPMFIQPHDPEYIPLEDEHILLAEEQPLPPVVSPTAESPGDDNNGDSSRDDADDEDEDEEEEHLAPADFDVVIPSDELVSPPEGAEPVIPPPSTDTATIGARITVRLQAAISFPSKAEVGRLIAMPNPSPSPLTSLSPPSAGERLARCTAPAVLPSPRLPPPLHMPPPVDRRDDISEREMPPRKRLCLSTLGSRYEVRESSTDRPTGGQGIDYGFVSTLDAEARRQRIKEVRVTELAELHEHDTHDLYALLEDAQDSRTRISQRVAMDSQRVDLLMEDRIAHQETIQIVEDEAYAAREAWAYSIGLSQAVHSELQTHQEKASGTDGRDSPSDGRHEMRDGRHAGQAASTARIMTPVTRQGPSNLPNNTNPNNMTQESVQAMIDQALLRNSTNGDGSHNSHEDNRRNVQTARPCFYADFMKCQPLNFRGTEGVVKFATCTLLYAALTWWNSQIRSLGPDAYSRTWEVKENQEKDKIGSKPDKNGKRVEAGKGQKQLQ